MSRVKWKENIHSIAVFWYINHHCHRLLHNAPGASRQRPFPDTFEYLDQSWRTAHVQPETQGGRKVRANRGISLKWVPVQSPQSTRQELEVSTLWWVSHTGLTATVRTPNQGLGCQPLSSSPQLLTVILTVCLNRSVGSHLEKRDCASSCGGSEMWEGKPHSSSTWATWQRHLILGCLWTSCSQPSWAWTPATRKQCLLFMSAGRMGCIVTQTHTQRGLPRWLGGKEPSCWGRRGRFHPWVRKIPWRRKWQPYLWVRKIPWRRKWQRTWIFLAGESHRHRSLVGYSPWGHKESNTNEAIQHVHLTYALKERDLFSTLSRKVWETQQLVLLFGGVPLWGGLRVPPGAVFTHCTSQVGMCGQVQSWWLPSPPRDLCKLRSHFPTTDAIYHFGPTNHEICSSAWPSLLMDCECREAENKLCARLLIKPGLHSLISL